MRYEEINKKFNKKVARWMGKGYWINTGTMSGSQGEIAKIDMTNGKEIIRVLMENRTMHSEEFRFESYDTVVIVVGKVTDEVRPNGTNREYNTVWNNHLEVLEQDTYYMIGMRWSNSNWYGTKAEAESQRVKARLRYHQRGSQTEVKVFENAVPVVRSFVKRQRGCKTIKDSDITEVRKVISYDFGRWTVRYEVKAKGSYYKMA